MSWYNNVNSSKNSGKRDLIHTCVCKQYAEISQDFRQFGNIYIERDVCIHVYMLLDSRITVVQFPCGVFYPLELRKLMS